MASIPLVDLSERSGCGIDSGPRLIGMAMRQNRPGDTGELVGERDLQHVALHPFRGPHDPRPQTAHGGAWPSHQHDMGGLHDQRSQVFVAAAPGRRTSTTWAACTNSVLRYLLP